MTKARLLAVVGMGALGATLLACGGHGGSGSRTDDATSRSKGKHGTADDPNAGATSAEPGSDPVTPPDPNATATPHGHDGGAGDGGGTASAGGAVCKAIPSCAATTELSPVRGDGVGSDTKTTGAGSQWFSIRVQDQALGSASMSVDVLLAPPSGATYEVHAYETDCTTELAAPVTLSDGSVDVYSAWTGKGKNIVIEVRYVGGACDATKKWTLDVTGAL